MNARKLLTTVITLSIVTGQLSNVFADDFVPADVTTGTVTATAGLNSTGATIDLNASSNFTTNINTGTSTGAVTIGNSAAGAIGIASGSAFTIAGGATSTLSTTAGNLNLQPAGAGTGNVQVGTGAGTGTPDLLVLDNKNTAGDPAGSVGATYYNSNIGKFRCYEGAAWKDCDTTGGGGSTLQAAYNAGATITTAGAVPLAFTLTSGGFNVTGAGATAIGNNTGTVAVDSTSWDISAAGVASGLTGLTSSGTVNFTAGMSASGAAVNLNNNSNFATNVGTGTSTGAVSVGGGANTVAVNSSDWDISATGAMTGISGITNDAALTTTGGAVSLNASSNFAVNIGTGTTTSAVSIGGGANQVAINSSTWDISGAGAASGLTGLATSGTVSLGNNTGTVAIDSSDWDISTTGAMTGIGAITMDGLLTGTAGATVTGAAVNLNASSNFATNINTGTSTGGVTVGGSSNTTLLMSSAVGVGASVPGTNLHIYENNTDTAPTFLIEQDDTGDASMRYLLTGGQTVSSGIDNDDNDNWKIGNASTLTGNTYADANTLFRIHTEAGSEGIVDLNHQSRARAFRNTTVQSIPNNAWTKVQFNGESYDEKAEFDSATNYRFVALEEGYYQVNARTSFTITQASANQYNSIAIYRNGAVYSYGNNLAIGTSDNARDIFSNNAPNVSDVIYLTTGQYIEIFVFQNAGVAQNINFGASETYVSIHKVS
jgi:hypothetical protein